MKQELKILILILVMFATIGCVSQPQTQLQAQPQSQRQTYQNFATNYVEYKTTLFSIKYPANWSRVSYAGFVVAFEDPYRESKNSFAISRKVMDSFTPESVAVSEKQSQSANYPWYQVISEGPTNNSAYKRVYKWHDPDRGDITQIQVWIKNDNVLYTIIATLLTSETDMYEPIFNWMIDSFKINS